MKKATVHKVPEDKKSVLTRMDKAINLPDHEIKAVVKPKPVFKNEEVEPIVDKEAQRQYLISISKGETKKFAKTAANFTEALEDHIELNNVIGQKASPEVSKALKKISRLIAKMQ